MFFKIIPFQQSERQVIRLALGQKRLTKIVNFFVNKRLMKSIGICGFVYMVNQSIADC